MTTTSRITFNGKEIPVFDQYGRPFHAKTGDKIKVNVSEDETVAWVVVGNRKERRAHESRERKKK